MSHNNRKDFYETIKKQNMTPLWEVLDELVTQAPQDDAIPHMWKFNEIKKHIIDSGDLITAKEAERRVLILENPGLMGKSRITNTLYAGMQLVLPGEIAPNHRHTQSALRFIIEGEGAYTTVDGEKVIMKPGDFIITPNWSWHDHGNETNDYVIWLDGLDIPLVKFLNSSFSEKSTLIKQSNTHSGNISLSRYSNGLIPDNYQANSLGSASPLFSYPYSKSKSALYGMLSKSNIDPYQGVKLKYVNPTNGSYAIPTIATFMQLFPRNFESLCYQSTESIVFNVVEGEGKSKINEKMFSWKAKDTFVAPSWSKIKHFSEKDSIIFSFSDRPIQELLGLWREKKIT